MQSGSLGRVHALRGQRGHAGSCRGICYLLNPGNARLPKIAREGSLIGMKPPFSTAPHILGGTPVFAGTRVPVQTLLDYLEAGESIDDFLDGFPSVSRDQIISFLEMAKDRLIETAL